VNRKPPITFQEYERIFRVLHSISRRLDNRLGVSCPFYNTAGAHLLESCLGISARPRMGSAFVRVDDATDTVMAFGVVSENGLECDSNEHAFHCWIETSEHIVDFTAPVYSSYMERWPKEAQIDIPRKMFIKSKTNMALSHTDLRTEGDFYMQPNLALAQQLLQNALKSSAVGDLIVACQQWFVKPPKKMPTSLTLMNDLGAIIDVQLTKTRIIGAW